MEALHSRPIGKAAHRRAEDEARPFSQPFLHLGHHGFSELTWEKDKSKRKTALNDDLQHDAGPSCHYMSL